MDKIFQHDEDGIGKQPFSQKQKQPHLGHNPQQHLFGSQQGQSGRRHNPQQHLLGSQQGHLGHLQQSLLQHPPLQQSQSQQGLQGQQEQ